MPDPACLLVTTNHRHGSHSPTPPHLHPPALRSPTLGSSRPHGQLQSAPKHPRTSPWGRQPDLWASQGDQRDHLPHAGQPSRATRTSFVTSSAFSGGCFHSLPSSTPSVDCFGVGSDGFLHVVFSCVSLVFVVLDVESSQHLSVLETRQGSESKHCSAEHEEAGGAGNSKHKLTPSTFHILQPALG